MHNFLHKLLHKGVSGMDTGPHQHIAVIYWQAGVPDFMELFAEHPVKHDRC